MTHLSRLLWKSRWKKRITLEEIARGLGYSVSKGTRKYLAWERGEQYPEKQQLQQLIKVMKLNRKQVERTVEYDRSDYEKWLDEPIPMTLVVRIIPGVYASPKVPENLSPEEAEKWACQYARKEKRKACLVLSRRESVWINEQGEIYSRTAGRPFMMVGGRRFCLGLLGDSEMVGFHVVKPDHPLCER
jgi:hypothetical protein